MKELNMNELEDREMIEQRERFQRFWDSIIAPQISDKSERERMELMHKAWGIWRDGN